MMRGRASAASGPRCVALFWIIFCLAAAIVAVRPAGALETIARQAILIDDTTGTVLMEKSADEPMAPSSMSKIMTVYMVFERLGEGTLSLDDTFAVSEKAWRMGGSRMFVENGEREPVKADGEVGRRDHDAQRSGHRGRRGGRNRDFGCGRHWGDRRRNRRASDT